MRRLGIDVLNISPAPLIEKREDGRSSIDIWGVKRKWIGHYNEIVHHPLRGVTDPAQLDQHNWPELKCDWGIVNECAESMFEKTDYYYGVLSSWLLGQP
jgi:hypothetical protein